MHVLPADNAVRLLIHPLTYAAWGKELTLPQYIQREEVLAGTTWSKDGLSAFFLVSDSAVLPGSESIISSLEIYAMEARVRDADGLRDTSAIGFASVFTPESHRGNRYALKLMAECMRTVPNEVTIAFSEVGPDVYKAVGLYPVVNRDEYIFALERAFSFGVRAFVFRPY